MMGEAFIKKKKKKNPDFPDANNSWDEKETKWIFRWIFMN